MKRRGSPTKLRASWLVYGGLLVAAAAVGGILLLGKPGTESLAPALAGDDFRIVAYQGDDALGGHESQFSRVIGHGKPVVLNFFAGQCPPCRAEMPGFQRVADEFDGKVAFVGIDVGPYLQLGSHEDAKQLLRDLKIRYAAGYAVVTTPLTIYQIQGMPTTVFFDGKGQQVAKRTGIMTEAELRGQLTKLTAS